MLCWSHHIINEDRITIVCIAPGSSQHKLKYLFSDLCTWKKKKQKKGGGGIWYLHSCNAILQSTMLTDCLYIIRLNAQVNSGSHSDLASKVKNNKYIYV